LSNDAIDLRYPRRIVRPAQLGRPILNQDLAPADDPLFDARLDIWNQHGENVLVVLFRQVGERRVVRTQVGVVAVLEVLAVGADAIGGSDEVIVEFCVVDVGEEACDLYVADFSQFVSYLFERPNLEGVLLFLHLHLAKHPRPLDQSLCWLCCHDCWLHYYPRRSRVCPKSAFCLGRPASS
jgi:hypothetical protein